MNTLKLYLLNVLIALDQLGNTLIGGDPDETISSRAGKEAVKGVKWACVLCKFLNYLQKDHCGIAKEPDEGDKGVVKD